MAQMMVSSSLGEHALTRGGRKAHRRLAKDARR
jgi:hypothetical protein